MSDSTGNPFTSAIGLLVLTYLFMMAGCNGFCSWSGSGLKVCVDQNCRYLRVNPR
jgi:hypothetical protein